MLQVIELARSDKLVVVRALTLIGPIWGPPNQIFRTDDKVNKDRAKHHSKPYMDLGDVASFYEARFQKWQVWEII